jgi:hypothetical protein
LNDKLKVPKKKGKDPFAWKKNKPKSGEAHIKSVDDKKYHWCVKHQAWTIHTPENCHLNKKSNDTIADPQAKMETPPEQEPSLTMSTALKAIAEGGNPEWDDDEESQNA